MTRMPVLAIAFTMLAAPMAWGQQLDLSKGGPVDVTARGGFEWIESEQKVVATGDARAVRDNVTVLADKLTAFYRKKPGTAAAAPAPGSTAKSGAVTDADGGNNEVYRLEADGHVRILTPTDEAVGGRAIYDIDQAVLVLTGTGLKLTTPQQVMTARDSMEYWSQKHVAVGRGAAVVVTSDGRRLAGDTLVAYTDPGAASAASAAPAGVKPADPVAASGKVQRIEAFGNVEVRTATDLARGDRGVYVTDSQMARLVGHVRITHEQTQINGPAADVDMKTGLAHLASVPGERVSGLIVPSSARTPPKATK